MHILSAFVILLHTYHQHHHRPYIFVYQSLAFVDTSHLMPKNDPGQTTPTDDHPEP